jgi:hypothetical protein
MNDETLEAIVMMIRNGETYKTDKLIEILNLIKELKGLM